MNFGERKANFMSLLVSKKHYRKGNMSTTTYESTSGINFTGLLTLVFITLKLTHVIKWSWWWVLAPVWISAAVLVVFLLVLLVVCLVRK